MDGARYLSRRNKGQVFASLHGDYAIGRKVYCGDKCEAQAEPGERKSEPGEWLLVLHGDDGAEILLQNMGIRIP